MLLDHQARHWKVYRVSLSMIFNLVGGDSQVVICASVSRINSRNGTVRERLF